MATHTNYTETKYHSAFEPETETDLGPAMRALNSRQRAVIYYLLDGGQLSSYGGWSKACRAAGYAGNDGACYLQASRMKRDPKMSEALVEEGRRRVAHDIPGYLATLRAIGTDPSHKDAIKGALAGLGMVGISPVSVSRSEHVVRHTSGSLLDQIRADCAAIGVDPEEFLRGRLIEAPHALIEHQPMPFPDDPLDISDCF